MSHIIIWVLATCCTRRKDHIWGKHNPSGQISDIRMVYSEWQITPHHLSQNWFLIRRMPLTTDPVSLSMVSSSHLSNTNNPFDPEHVLLQKFLSTSTTFRRKEEMDQLSTWVWATCQSNTSSIEWTFKRLNIQCGTHKSLTTANNSRSTTQSMAASATLSKDKSLPTEFSLTSTHLLFYEHLLDLKCRLHKTCAMNESTKTYFSKMKVDCHRWGYVCRADFEYFD